MNRFIILQSSTPNPDVLPFGKLNPKVCHLLEGDLDILALGQVFGGVNKQFLSLHHLSLNPLVALSRLGCTNTQELASASQYLCGFLGVTRQFVLPLGIVVNGGIPGLRKYDEAFERHARDGARPETLHLLPDGQRFAEENLFDDSEQSEIGIVCRVNRFEQLYLGSGCTREMLAGGDSDAVLSPVSLTLSNGDTLAAYAYGKF